MCVVMKCDCWAVRRGSISLTEGESDSGVTLREGAAGAEDAMEDFSGFKDAADNGLAWLLSMGDSTCCVVELKNRARLGKRKVGGSVALGIRMSNKDFLIVLLNILRSRTLQIQSSLLIPEFYIAELVEA